jgi:hypothetical protein
VGPVSEGAGAALVDAAALVAAALAAAAVVAAVATPWLLEAASSPAFSLHAAARLVPSANKMARLAPTGACAERAIKAPLATPQKGHSVSPIRMWRWHAVQGANFDIGQPQGHGELRQQCAR